MPPIITNRQGQQWINKETGKPVRFYRLTPGNFPEFLQQLDANDLNWECLKDGARSDLKATKNCNTWNKTPWEDLTSNQRTSVCKHYNKIFGAEEEKLQRQAVVDHYNRIYEGELAKEAEKVAAKRERKTTNKREERKKEAEVEDDRKPC